MEDCTHDSGGLSFQLPYPEELDQKGHAVVCRAIHNDGGNFDGPVLVEYGIRKARLDGGIEGAGYEAACDGLY